MIVRFQVLTAASMKMAVFWVVAPCSLVEVYRRFRGACCLHHQGDRNNREDSVLLVYSVHRIDPINIFCKDTMFTG
jgi:hypothetical protein